MSSGFGGWSDCLKPKPLSGLKTSTAWGETPWSEREMSAAAMTLKSAVASQSKAARPNPCKISPISASGSGMRRAWPTPSRDLTPPEKFRNRASPRARSANPLPLSRPRLPALTSRRAAPSPEGFRVMMFNAPPMVLRPDRLPWGPRNTSTRSMFIRSMLAPMLRPKYTPSR